MPANLRHHVPGDVGSEVLRLLIDQYNNLRAGKFIVNLGHGIAGAPDDRAPSLAIADTIGEYPILTVTEATGIMIDDVQFVSSGALTSNDTNFRTVTLRTRNAAGGGAAIVGEFTTETAVTGGTGNLTAFVPISYRDTALGSSGTPLSAPLLMEQGTTLTLQSTIAAAGLAVAGGVLIIHHRTKAGEIVLSRVSALRPGFTDGLRVPT